LFIAEIVSLSFFRYLIGDQFRRRWSRTGTTSLEHDISMRDHSLSSSVSGGKLAVRMTLLLSKGGEAIFLFPWLALSACVARCYEPWVGLGDLSEKLGKCRK